MPTRMETDINVCTICERPEPLTLEHVIPRVLGGTAVVRIQCDTCNSTLGSTVISQLKLDPVIRLAVRGVKRVCPEFHDAFEDRQSYVATDTSGQTVRLRLRKGTLSVTPGHGPNRSLVFDTEEHEEHIKGVLASAGLEAVPIDSAIQHIKTSEANEAIRLSDALTVVRREIVNDSVFPDLGAARQTDDRAPVLIAYNWLCARLGRGIFDARFAPVRSMLQGQPSQRIRVDRLMAKRRGYEPFHVVQAIWRADTIEIGVRLFGSVAYAVNIGASIPEWTTRLVGVQDLLSRHFSVIETDMSA